MTFLSTVRWKQFFISCNTGRSKHIWWVNNANLSSTQKTILVLCRVPSHLLLRNNQAVNQHVFIWDSSWKRLDAQHEQPLQQCQRFLWTHSSPEGSCVHPLPAQVSGMSRPLSDSVVKVARTQSVHRELTGNYIQMRTIFYI